MCYKSGSRKKPSIKKLKLKMDAVFFHFYCFRNNSRNLTFAYLYFIAIFGFDNWDRVIPNVKNAWEMARNDFDKMHGIVRSLFKCGIAVEDLIREEPEKVNTDASKEKAETNKDTDNSDKKSSDESKNNSENKTEEIMNPENLKSMKIKEIKEWNYEQL